MSCGQNEKFEDVILDFERHFLTFYGPNKSLISGENDRCTSRCFFVPVIIIFVVDQSVDNFLFD